MDIVSDMIVSHCLRSSNSLIPLDMLRHTFYRLDQMDVQNYTSFIIQDIETHMNV